MPQSVTKRSRTAQALACVGLVLWVVAFGVSWRGPLLLAGLSFIAGLTLILCAVLMSRPYVHLRMPRIDWSLDLRPLPGVQGRQAGVVEEIGWRLGVLASRAAQERYMVGATSDAYLLMDQAVEDALGVTDARLVRRMDPHTMAAVVQFLRVFRAELRHVNALPQLPWDMAVLENRSLAATRSAARHCLAGIGFDLAAWEREKGFTG